MGGLKVGGLKVDCTFFRHQLKSMWTNLNHQWVTSWCQQYLEFLILDQLFSISSSFPSGSFTLFLCWQERKESSNMNSNMKYLSNSNLSLFRLVLTGTCPVYVRFLVQFLVLTRFLKQHITSVWSENAKHNQNGHKTYPKWILGLWWGWLMRSDEKS